ncbi:MAG: glycosyltransferase family 4 protein [Thermoanaerobaculaceae bacterium]|nr:glycosyltransferase family 4 protein [Thermoanaerobaculaceae bacterium]MDI9621338.1 glycosyltransferase family 4 protein [Acidobacteriota bacterium]NLH12444.1 glycosyltransferase family 4 protein [Holophagae bacterium]HPW54130.1 glycosyltransferase family 4 protein [Thermoanaerobaculaceae bacterium]
MTDRPRVVLVSHSARLGGAERALLETVDALLSGGFGCRALLPRAGPLREALEERRVPVVVLPFKWWTALPHTGRWRRAMRTGWNVVLAAWLAGRLRAWGCDLVYSNTLSVFVGALAARMARRPHVWHVHELGLRHTGALFDVGEQRALRLLDRWSDTLVACSRAVEAWLAASVPPEKIRVVYQSVPAGTDLVGAIPKGPRVRLVCVGSLSRFKRQGDAVQALARLVERGVDAELLLVGEGDPAYLVQLVRLVEHERLTDRVQLLGELPSAWPVLASADVVVTCSQHEGFGRTVVEAMKAGKPVVGADSGGTAELIRHGATGLLYPAADVTALADAVELLVRDRELARRVAQEGRRWATATFSSAAHAWAVEQVVREALRRRQAEPLPTI